MPLLISPFVDISMDPYGTVPYYTERMRAPAVTVGSDWLIGREDRDNKDQIAD